MLLNSRKNQVFPRNHSRSILLAATITTLLIAPLQSVVAQSDPADESLLEEIIVTSRRYEESLEDAPVAVNVLTEDYIISNRIQRADDILDFTPRCYLGVFQ